MWEGKDGPGGVKRAGGGWKGEEGGRAGEGRKTRGGVGGRSNWVGVRGTWRERGTGWLGEGEIAWKWGRR